MKSKISAILLISIFLGGCSILSPFKSINSCKDAKGNGVPCASVESNLEYSINRDNPEAVQTEAAETEKDKKKKSKKENAELPVPAHHDETEVEKDEIVRLMAEMSIDADVTKKPTLIPPATYRMLIFPYSVKDRFYSARYIYITAGKPRWVTGNYILSDEKPLRVDTPKAGLMSGKAEDMVSRINLNGGMPAKKEAEQTGEAAESEDKTAEEITGVIKQAASENNSEEPEAGITAANAGNPVKHRVNAYLLNCRDMPGLEGNSIAVFEKDSILDVTDKSLSWWQVRFYDTSCWVNPKYLYSEPAE